MVNFNRGLFIILTAIFWVRIETKAQTTSDVGDLTSHLFTSPILDALEKCDEDDGCSKGTYSGRIYIAAWNKKGVPNQFDINCFDLDKQIYDCNKDGISDDLSGIDTWIYFELVGSGVFEYLNRDCQLITIPIKENRKEWWHVVNGTILTQNTSAPNLAGRYITVLLHREVKNQSCGSIDKQRCFYCITGPTPTPNSGAVF